MIEEKLKIIEETLYEIFVKKIDEWGVSFVTACMILRGIESRVQDKAISELSLRVLQENQNKSQQEKESEGE